MDSLTSTPTRRATNGATRTIGPSRATRRSARSRTAADTTWGAILTLATSSPGPTTCPARTAGRERGAGKGRGAPLPPGWPPTKKPPRGVRPNRRAGGRPPGKNPSEPKPPDSVLDDGQHEKAGLRTPEPEPPRAPAACTQ